MNEGSPETRTLVGVPAATLRLLAAGVVIAVVVMLAMLGVEVVILLKVFEMLDLLHRIAPAP